MDRNHLQCPVCMDLHYLPPEGIPGLKSDFKVSKMTEFLKLVKDGQGECEQCVVCLQQGKGSQSTHFCTVCRLHLCSKCTQIHNDNPLFRGHSTTLKTDAQSSLMCAEHTLRNAQHYCSKCKQAVCSVCILTRHDNHDVIECDSLQRQRINDLQAALQSRIDLMRNSLKEMEKLDVILNVNYVQSRECIEQTRTKLVQQIDKKCIKALSSLTEAETEQQNTCMAQKDKCMEMLGELQSFQTFMEGLLSDDENHVFYPGLPQVVQNLEDTLRRDPPKVPHSLKISTQFQPNFEVAVGKLVKIEVLQNKLFPSLEETGAEALMKPQSTSQHSCTSSTLRVAKKSKGKSSKSIFSKLGSKLSVRKKTHCDHCHDNTKYYTCHSRGPSSTSMGRSQSEQSLNVNSCRNSLQTKTQGHKNAPKVGDGDVPEEDPKKYVQNLTMSKSPQPSAPLYPDVFEEEDSGMCESSDSSDLNTTDVDSSASEPDNQFQSAESLNAGSISNNGSGSARPGEVREGTISMSGSAVSTLTMCVSDMLEPAYSDEDDDDAGALLKKEKSAQENAVRKTSSCSQKSSAPSSQNCVHHASSQSSSPALNRQRSESTPSSVGSSNSSSSCCVSMIQTRRVSNDHSWRNQSLSGLLLGEFFDQLSNRNSFRY